MRHLGVNGVVELYRRREGRRLWARVSSSRKDNFHWFFQLVPNCKLFNWVVQFKWLLKKVKNFDVFFVWYFLWVWLESVLKVQGCCFACITYQPLSSDAVIDEWLNVIRWFGKNLPRSPKWHRSQLINLVISFVCYSDMTTDVVGRVAWMLFLCLYLWLLIRSLTHGVSRFGLFVSLPCNFWLKDDVLYYFWLFCKYILVISSSLLLWKCLPLNI